MKAKTRTDVVTLLGSVLVKLGRRDLRAVASRLEDARLSLFEIATWRGAPIDVLQRNAGTSLPGVSNLTTLVTAAMTRVAKNDLQGGYQRVAEAQDMTKKMLAVQDLRRGRVEC